MIANERQYRIARAELRRFEEAIEAHRQGTPGKYVDPRVYEAMGSSLHSEAEDLRAQIQRYEDLRDGRVDRLEIEGLRELPVALIEARIAAGLTQKALAKRLRLREQQIQRWEASLYSGVGVERLQEIVDALDMGIRETIHYAVST